MPLEKKQVREFTNLVVRLISFLMLGAGLLLLWVSGWSSVVALSAQLSAFLSQLGGLLVATGAVTIAWERWGQRKFAQELFEMANLSTDLRHAGLKRVGNWMELEPSLWEGLFRDVKTIDILMAYSAQVIGSQRYRLVAALQSGAVVRVFLPDPEDELTMESLAYRFRSDAESLRIRVRQAIKTFEEIQASAPGSNLSVHTRRGPLTYACYRFDSRVVFTLYSQSRDRHPYVPTFMVEGGHLFGFFSGDLEALSKANQPTTQAETK